MELLVQPRHGLTADLLRYVSTVAEGSVSFLVFFTGSHRISEYIDRYKIVLVIASRFGIATVIPYLKKIIYSYNTCTSQIYQLYLV